MSKAPTTESADDEPRGASTLNHSAPETAIRSLCVVSGPEASRGLCAASARERELLDDFERKRPRCPKAGCGLPSCQLNPPHLCFRHFRDKIAQRQLAQTPPLCGRMGCWARATSTEKPHLCLVHILARDLPRSKTK